MNLKKLTLVLPVFLFQLIGFSLIGQCPSIEAIMVNGCSIPNESDGEFLILNSGGSGFNVDDLGIDVPSNTTGVNDNMGTAGGCAFMTPPLNAALAGCSNVISVGPGDFIPGNAIVVVMTSSGGDASEYDWMPLCGSGETVYLLQNSCDRTAGAFKDFQVGAGTRTTTITLPGCSPNSLTYDTEDLASGTSGSGGNGDYVLPCTPSPSCPDGVEYGNNGCVVPPVTVPCTPNGIDAIADVTQCDSYTLPAITGSNLSGNEAFYTGTGGTGTQYNSGDAITTTTTLFVYDATSACSDEISFSITINTSPTANTPASSLNFCAVIIPPTLISDNLSAVENEIAGGNGSLTVNWYTDMAGTIAVSFANVADVLALLPTPATVYATVSDANCESSTVPVTVNVETQPNANPAAASACDEGGGTATFDLTTLDGTIDGNGNVVTFYTDMAATNIIANPGSYNTASTTVYAVVGTVNACNSNPVAVSLTVLAQLDVNFTVSPTDACQSADVIVTFNISGPDMYDFTLQYTDMTNGTTAVDLTTGSGGTFPLTITETTTFEVIAATDPVNGCPFTILASPETVTITPGPDISPISDVTVCDSYTLPVITGSGLSGSEIYYSEPNGTGTPFNPGDIISSSTQLFAFDGMLPDCFDEEPFMITITPVPNLQLNGTAQVCAGEGFELSSIVVDFSGSGIPVTYHSTSPPNAANQLPSSFVVPGATTTYYAFADGGIGCQSTLEITVTVLPLPTANAASLSACDEGGNAATFDLTSLNNIVNGNTGFTVTWYIDMGLNTQINNPESFISSPTTIYANVFDANCSSSGAAVTLSILPSPVINPADPLEGCDDGSGQATFDLTQLNNTVNGGNGNTVNWFTDMNMNNSIGTPASFTSGSTIVFASVFDGTCSSEVQAINLIVNNLPEAFDYQIEACGTPNAIFDLTTFDVTNAVNGGTGAIVNWYTNSAGTAPLNSPDNFVTPVTTIVYAATEVNGCNSPTAEVILTVTQAPSATAADLSACDDGSGQAIFNLTTLNNTVNGGSGLIVNYFTDAAGNSPILIPNNFVSGSATVFAQVDNATCPSELVPIVLTIQPGPVANDTNMESCDEGGNAATFDLTSLDFVVSNGTGNVSWFITTAPLDPVPDPQFYNTSGGMVYAVVDNGVCTAEATVTLTVNSNPQVGMVLTQPISCFGATDAALEVTVSNGVPVFMFDWNENNLDGTEDPVNLGAGMYSLTVTDGNGCVSLGSFDISQPNELTLNCSELSPVTTVGGNDGQASINITGGTVSFIIDWSGPISGSQLSNTEGTSIIDNLEAGNYAVVITDGNNCNTNCSFTITDPNCDLTLGITGEDPDCNGNATGNINLTINGGTPGFTIVWNDNGLDGTEDPSNITAGDYQVTVSDAGGCSATTSITLIDPALLSLNCIEQTPVSSQGGSDGVATIDFSGGTAPYLLSWSGASSGSQNQPLPGSTTITGLVAGNYSITLTDANTCTTICELIINEPGCDLNLEILGTDPLCANEATGIIDLTINGGASPLTIDWSVDSLDGLEDLVDLLEGIYAVSVTDDNNCLANISVALTNPEILILSCSQQNPVSTQGGNDGVAGIDFSGGMAPYLLSWSGASSGSQNQPTPGSTTITGLTAGNYGITLTDANDCSTTCNFTINQPGCSLSLQITGFDESCPEENDGRIELIVFNGSLPLTFDWSDDSLDGINEPMSLSPGNYSVTVTDANNCESVISVIIGTEFSLPGIELSPGGIICEGACFDFNLTPSGTAPFIITYSLNDGISSPLFSFSTSATDTIIQICPNDLNLNGNNITFILEDITDANCSNPVDLIENIEIFTSTFGDYQDQLCPDENVIINGTTYDINTPVGTEILAGANASGCDSIVNISLTFYSIPEFDLNETICQAASLIINGTTYDQSFPSGIEILEGQSSNGCDSVVNINLTFFDTPVFDLNQTLCEGESLVLNGTTYDQNLPSGTEILEGQSAGGCDSIVNINLNFIPAITASLTGGTNICAGESTTLTFNYSEAGTFSVQYIGENGNSQLLNNISGGYTIEVSPAASTAYAIEFIIASGTNCPVLIENDATVNVSQLETQIIIEQDVLCSGTAEGILSVEANSGIPPFSYSWNTGAVTNQISNLAAGTFSVEVTDAAGCVDENNITLSAPNAIEVWLHTTAPNCFDSLTGSISVDSVKGGDGNFEYSFDGVFFQPLPVLPLQLTGLTPGAYILHLQDGKDCLTESDVFIPDVEELTADLGGDLLIELGESTHLNGLVNFNVDSLVWFPVDSLSDPESLNTEVNPINSTTYVLTVFDQNGCFASDDIRIIVNRDVPVFIPSVFSPNDDGVNDVFMIYGGKGVVLVNDFIIFDRWGNTVFEAGPFPPNDPTFGWNGKTRGQPLNPAVFVYHAEVLFADGRTEKLKGDVTLIR